MSRISAFFILLLLGLQVYGQKEAYTIFTAEGKKVNYDQMLKGIGDKDIVLFGEIHNNPIAHWLQYEVTADLHRKRALVLGAEMFEADNQQALTDYVTQQITAEALDTLARLWSNYDTDYAPLVDFARENQLDFVATNIPRRYANLVFRKGFEALDTLSDEEKTWMAPLPMPFDSELSRYKNILIELGDHGSPELVMAQSTKDATMAHFILRNFKKDQLFLHFNGAYHSDFYEGILWYLKRAVPDLKYGTISTVSQEKVDKLEKEHRGKADFIICVDSDMTTTY